MEFATSIFQIENCDLKKMKREIMGVATRYNPVQIDLNQTINSDTNFLDFISNVDTNCLVNNADFDTFSIRVLTKLQANHQAKYHQNCGFVMAMVISTFNLTVAVLPRAKR